MYMKSGIDVNFVVSFIGWRLYKLEAKTVYKRLHWFNKQDLSAAHLERYKCISQTQTFIKNVYINLFIFLNQ